MLQNHDEVISRLRKMPRFAQRTHEIHSGHAGERAGDHARRDERGRIHQNGRRARDPDGDQQLPGVVPEGRQHAHDPQQPLRQAADGQAHDEIGEHAARNAEEHRRHAAGEHAAEHDAHEQDLPRLPPAEQGHGDERDDVGKAELHTRDRHDGRDLRLGDDSLYLAKGRTRVGHCRQDVRSCFRRTGFTVF